MKVTRYDAANLHNCVPCLMVSYFQTHPEVFLQTPPLRPALIWAGLVHRLKFELAHKLAHELDHLHGSEVSPDADPGSVSELRKKG